MSEHEESFEDRKKSWDISGSLENIIQRYVHQITNAELSEINLEMQSGMSEHEIKEGIKLPLEKMQHRRESILLQKENSLPEPLITVLKSNAADIPAGSNLSLLDADDLLLRRGPGSIEYQIQFLLHGKEHKRNATIDLSKMDGTETFADLIVGDAPLDQNLVYHFDKHRELSIQERGAKRLLRVNNNPNIRSYANALLSYVQKARTCLNMGQVLPDRPLREDFVKENTGPQSTAEVEKKANIIDVPNVDSNVIFFEEPQITILQSTLSQIPAGTKMSLPDAELMFKGLSSGYIAYQIDYTFAKDNLYQGSYHGKINFDRTHDKSIPDQIKAAALSGPAEMSSQDFSNLTPESMKIYQNQMNWLIDSFVPYLRNHENLSAIHLQADNILLKQNRETWETSYAKGLLSYVKEARKCLNNGEPLPALPLKESFQLTEKSLENQINSISADSQPVQDAEAPKDSTEKSSKIPVTINEKLLALQPHDGKILSQIPASEKYVELDLLSTIDNGKTFLASIDPDKEYPLFLKEDGEWKSAGSRPGNILSYSYGNVRTAAKKEFNRLMNQTSHVSDTTHQIDDSMASVSEFENHPESPEAEHLQKSAADLLDLSHPLVDQEAFQEVFQALQQNAMPQAADMLQFLASHLDESQEHYRSMQNEFQQIKIKIAEIDKKLFTDQACVNEAQAELERGENFVRNTRNRLANLVMNARNSMVSHGKSALISLAESIRVPETLEALQNCMQRTEKSLNNVFYRLNDTRQAIHDVALGVKNIGRSLTGKELLTYKPWDVENGAIASMQRKIYAMERGLNYLQKQTKTLQGQMRPPKNKAKKPKKERPTTINI